ncbi:MAG: DUF1854 domain-containing protein [Gemmatimonadetes bacterium]|nr:DUF1854 domain-containing protein [Gemmatimonadota bacterium]
MARVDGAFAEHLEGVTERGGRLFVRRPGTDEEVAVTVRYLRPLTSPTEIVFLDEKNREVATLRSVEALTPEQRSLVEPALRERYHLLTITRVHEVDVRFGTRYWRVDTDRGPRWFTLREPGKNVSWITEQRLVLRDSAGNRYQVTDLVALDERSRTWVTRSL